MYNDNVYANYEDIFENLGSENCRVETYIALRLYSCVYSTLLIMNLLYMHLHIVRWKCF